MTFPVFFGGKKFLGPIDLALDLDPKFLGSNSTSF